MNELSHSITRTFALCLFAGVAATPVAAQSLGDTVGGVVDGALGSVSGSSDGISASVGDSGTGATASVDGGDVDASVNVLSSTVDADANLSTDDGLNGDVNLGLLGGTTDGLLGDTEADAQIGVEGLANIGLNQDGTNTALSLGDDSESTGVSVDVPGIGTVDIGLPDDGLLPGAPGDITETSANEALASASNAEMAELKLTCRRVLSNPVSFDSDIIGLCKMVRAAKR